MEYVDISKGIGWFVSVVVIVAGVIEFEINKVLGIILIIMALAFMYFLSNISKKKPRRKRRR